MVYWNPSLYAFRLGRVEVRWYGLCWVIGLALAYVVTQRL